MAHVEKSLKVNVPVSTAYNQWTQFEEFPRFMEGVEEVKQIDERHLHWRADVGGQTKEWDAEIQEQVPDSRIIWRATDGTDNAGIVRFLPVGDAETEVHLQMSYLPESFRETIGDKLGFMSRRVEGNLERFRDFIEARGIETGAYRETLPNEDAPGGFTNAR